MKRILLLLFMLLYAAFARAQAGNTLTLTGSGAPTGTCAFLQFWVTTAGALYDCAGTSWNAVTGGGGNPAFSAITSGTNTGAAMVIGTGASLTVSGSGTNNATSLGGATFAAPGPIGSTTPSTGAFSTLSASSTVSGSGFSTYLASPPAIGGSAAAAGTFTTLTATTYSGGAFSGTFTGSPTFSGNIAFSGTPTFSNALALGSSTATTQSQNDNSTKLATTAYTDLAVANAVAGVNPAVAVNVATTQASDTSGLTYSNGVSGVGATFTGTTNTAITIDGFTFTTVGQRLLVKNDTQSPSGAFNGIYNVTQIQTGILPPILTRALDYDQPSDMNNTGAIPVISGTANGTTSWLLTSSVVTVGTTPLTFTQFSLNPTTQVTAASAAGAANQVAYSAGATRALSYTTLDNTTTHAMFATAGAPAFRAIASGDIPTLNQNTTGSAASLSVSGQTGLMTVAGLTSTNRIKTVRDAADTILELGGSYTPAGTWNWTSCSGCTWPTFNQSTTGNAATASNLSGCLGSTAGDICYYNSGWIRLAGNASGTKFLQSTSAGALSWASAGGGNPSLDEVTGSAAQATGTESAAGDNYTFAGVETGNLHSYISITDANSSNNNTNIGLLFGVTGSSTGGIGGLVYDISGTGALFGGYSGGSISNGAYTLGTQEFSFSNAGALALTGSLTTNSATNICGSSSPCFGGVEGSTQPTPAANDEFIHFNSSAHCPQESMNNSALECIPALYSSGAWTAGHAVTVHAQLGSGSDWDFTDAGAAPLLTSSSAHLLNAAFNCADTSGSGTAQSCTPSPSFTPGNGDQIVYTTTTPNSGAGLTIAVGGLGAKPVAKWQTTTTLAAGDICANTQIVMTYDGTNWEASTICNAPSGGGSGLSGMTASQVAIAATATTVTSSKAILGTDTSLASATGSFSASNMACGDANAGLTPCTAIPSGQTATTQSTNDNSTKVATTAYADQDKIWTGGSGIAGTPASTQWLFPNGQTASTTLTNAQASGTMVRAGTVDKLYVVLTAAEGASATLAFTIYKNTSAQTVTCTVGNSATTCNDTAHSFSFAAGDSIAMQTVQSGTGTSQVIQFGIGYH